MRPFNLGSRGDREHAEARGDDETRWERGRKRGEYVGMVDQAERERRTALEQDNLR